MAKADLTAQRLREVLDYNSETGGFTWKARVAQCTRVGAPIPGARGTHGHLTIGLFKHRYLAHRLAWLYHYGVWPNHHIDHVNGDPGDNRIANLRDATSSMNMQNRRTSSKRKHDLPLGVKLNKSGKNPYAAVINIGSFATPELAHAAYLSVKRLIHGGCTI